MTTIATNSEGLTFKQWFLRANVICIRTAGVGIEDLADGPSWDAWHDDMTPREYAEERLAEEGFPFQ